MATDGTDDLKARVLEIAQIARACPENLQEKCFELLLADLLARRTEPQGGAAAKRVGEGRAQIEPPEGDEISASEGESPDGQSDLGNADVHVKARRFLQKYNLTLEDLNQIFYKEGDSILPLYDDLRTTRLAESQIRIALLQSLRAGVQSGEFEFNGESVRSECQQRKCYDGGNFATNFRNSATLFEGFDKYNKTAPTIKLSEDGRRELAELIRELE
jgi:hypothetical protein